MHLVGADFWVIVLSCCMHLIVYAESDDCVVQPSGIGVQKDFEISKMSGTWYSTHKLQTSEATDVDSSAASGMQKIIVTGKDDEILVEIGTSNGDVCESQTFNAVQDEAESAKLILNGTADLHIWILSSDYEGYSLVFTCTVSTLNETRCNIVLWQRCPTSNISDAFRQDIDDHMRQLCAGVDLLVTEDQQQACFDIDCSMLEPRVESYRRTYYSQNTYTYKKSSTNVGVYVGGGFGAFAGLLLIIGGICLCIYCC